MFLDDKPKDECGVFGVFNHPDAAFITYLGLRALQHRGEESAGIVVSDENDFNVHLGMGLVSNVFDQEIIGTLEGHIAVGHNRYSTAGTSTLDNIQPFVRHYKRGLLAIAHNGNLVNATHIRSVLQEKGSIFSSTSDTEVIAHLIARSHQKYFEDRIIDALSEIRGAYSLIFMDRKRLIAVRDPYGFRPLWLGRLDDAYVLASETCALDIINAQSIREINPGEMLVINSTKREPLSIHYSSEVRRHHCIFEFIYLAKPDSMVFGELVNRPRREFGRQLAREHPVDADVVSPVPNSANICALGYAEESGIPFDMGLSQNRYVGRTFIHPTQATRELMVRIKLNPIKGVIEGKRVILVDDSIMRGTSCRLLIKLLKKCGADEVHFRISSPPNRFPCYYGIDTPTRKELIASSHTVEEIRKYIEADSLGYLSIEGMLKCVKRPQDFCTACFDGNYPLKFSEERQQQIGLRI